jgi:hypothetical protein
MIANSLGDFTHFDPSNPYHMQNLEHRASQGDMVAMRIHLSIRQAESGQSGCFPWALAQQAACPPPPER